jgi:hypothetical protein
MTNHDIFVRPARPEDSTLFTQWELSTRNNLFDPDAIKYPTSFTLAAYNKERIILFSPSQTPIMLEAIAVNPQASVLEIAEALKAIVQFLVPVAQSKGIGEIYFMTKDEAMIKFAEKRFEEMPWRTFRLKVNQLEPKNENNS